MKSLIVLLFSSGFLINQIHPVNSIEKTQLPEYEILLQTAAELNQSGEFDRALNQLTKANQLNHPPDAVYFKIFGDSLLGKGSRIDAVNNFSQSLKLNPNQPELLLQLTDIFREDDHPEEEYKYLRIYLTQTHDTPDMELLYRSLVLAARVGDSDYISAQSKNIASHPDKPDRDKTVSSVLEFLKSRDYEKSIIVCRKALPFFPDDTELHSLYLISLIKINSPLENALVAAAGLAGDRIRFTLQYGQYMLSQKKTFNALSAYRRAFLLGLAEESNLSEVFAGLKQVYFILGKTADQKAVAALEISIREKRDIDNLIQLNRDFPDSREILVYTLFTLKKTAVNSMQYNAIYEKLSRRDDKWQWREFIFGNHAFIKENLLEKILSLKEDNLHK